MTFTTSLLDVQHKKRQREASTVCDLQVVGGGSTRKQMRLCGGSGTTRPLPRDGGAEGLRGDPTVGPHPKVWPKDQG